MLQEGLNNLRHLKNGLHSHANCQCNCGVCTDTDRDNENCKAHTKTYRGTTALWEDVVCSKIETDLWHKYDCFMGLCNNCGVSKLPLCPLEVLPTGNSEPFLLQWKCFEKTIVGQTEAGQPKKRIREVYKNTSVSEFLEYLKPNLTKFVTYNFVARWQDSQYHITMADLPEDAILSHIDFAENYSFEIQNEIQSMHWFSHQVTILVHLTYRLNLVPDPKVRGSKWIKESHFYISDDKEHDTLFIQHCLLLHWNWLCEKGFKPRQHWVFSDGCSAQFKGSLAMYFVARYPGLTDGCSMRWEYFGSGHSKGDSL
jgi:hypothetical protein